MSKPVNIGDAERRITSAHLQDLEGNPGASAALGEGVIQGATESFETGDAYESGQVSAWQRILSKAFSAVAAARDVLTGRSTSSGPKPSSVNAASSNSAFIKRREQEEQEARARDAAEAVFASRRAAAKAVGEAKEAAMLRSSDDDELGLG